MRDYQIFSDSSCDVSFDILEEHNITLIPFYVSFDQEKYYKEHFELTNDEFYEKLTSEKIFPKTSLPSVQDYITHFKTALDAGSDVLCICITTKFSGSHQSAVTAKQILEEEYPDADIRVINSILATGAQGLLVLQAAYMKEAGYPLDQNARKLDELKQSARITFTVGTLEYLQKGGRIGKVASLAGTILNLKPLIQLKDAELIPYGTIRGRLKSLDKVVEMAKEHFEAAGESYDDYDFALLYGTEEKDIRKIQDKLEQLIHRKISYPLFRIGVTIGTYTGPDAVGISFIKKFNA